MLQRQPLQSQIIEFISDYIKANGMQKGDRLPAQAELAKMMGVSLVSVREATKTLEAKNFLEVRNGKGIFVSGVNQMSLTLQIEYKKEKEFLLNLLHLRKVLEKEVLTMLIKNATEEELDSIGAVLAELMRKYKAGLPQADEDRAFHHLIYSHCHNDVIYRLIISSDDLMNKFQDFPLGMTDPFTETIPLHELLYNAIRERDLKKALSINNKLLNLMVRDIQRA